MPICIPIRATAVGLAVGDVDPAEPVGEFMQVVDVLLENSAERIVTELDRKIGQLGCGVGAQPGCPVTRSRLDVQRLRHTGSDARAPTMVPCRYCARRI
jgi:hypothetical protein